MSAPVRVERSLTTKGFAGVPVLITFTLTPLIEFTEGINDCAPEVPPEFLPIIRYVLVEVVDVSTSVRPVAVVKATSPPELFVAAVFVKAPSEKSATVVSTIELWVIGTAGISWLQIILTESIVPESPETSKP